jgi:hypothetical protein
MSCLGRSPLRSLLLPLVVLLCGRVSDLSVCHRLLPSVVTVLKEVEAVMASLVSVDAINAAMRTWEVTTNHRRSEAGIRGMVWCCAVLCCAVLCCAVLCCAVLCCAVLCCAVLCCAVLCCAVLCCAALL